VKLHRVFHAKRTQIAYLFFEWAAYGSLSTFVRQKLSEKTVAAIFAQVSSGLAYLHSQGIVHHDIKPSNILLFAGGTAKLSDAGICHSCESADAAIGSPEYQPPEDFSDNQDDVVIDPVKEDVWGLGVSIYETAFGVLPWRGNTSHELARNILSSPLRIPNNGSEALRDLLLRMLDVNPEARFTLDEVRGHRFFKDADGTFSLPSSPQEVPARVSGALLKEIAVCPCDENYTFEGTARSHSWPRFLDSASQGR
jgi:serine/threonine protein kinase